MNFFIQNPDTMNTLIAVEIYAHLLYRDKSDLIFNNNLFKRSMTYSKSRCQGL